MVAVDFGIEEISYSDAGAGKTDYDHDLVQDPEHVPFNQSLNTDSALSDLRQYKMPVFPRLKSTLDIPLKEPETRAERAFTVATPEISYSFSGVTGPESSLSHDNNVAKGMMQTIIALIK